MCAILQSLISWVFHRLSRTTAWVTFKINSYLLYISYYRKFFNCLTSKMKHILTLFPFADVFILGDFSIHYQLWFFFSFIEYLGELPSNLSILFEWDQVVQHFTCNAQHIWHFLNLWSCLCSYTIISIGLLRSVSVKSASCPFAPIPPQSCRNRRYLYYFNFACWGDLRSYYNDFPC